MVVAEVAEEVGVAYSAESMDVRAAAIRDARSGRRRGTEMDLV
jgi:hypothetical protein